MSGLWAGNTPIEKHTCINYTSQSSPKSAFHYKDASWLIFSCHTLVQVGALELQNHLLFIIRAKSFHFILFFLHYEKTRRRMLEMSFVTVWTVMAEAPRMASKFSNNGLKRQKLKRSGCGCKSKEKQKRKGSTDFWSSFSISKICINEWWRCSSGEILFEVDVCSYFETSGKHACAMKKLEVDFGGDQQNFSQGSVSPITAGPTSIPSRHCCFLPLGWLFETSLIVLTRQSDCFIVCDCGRIHWTYPHLPLLLQQFHRRTFRHSPGILAENIGPLSADTASSAPTDDNKAGAHATQLAGWNKHRWWGNTWAPSMLPGGTTPAWAQT